MITQLVARLKRIEALSVVVAFLLLAAASFAILSAAGNGRPEEHRQHAVRVRDAAASERVRSSQRGRSISGSGRWDTAAAAAGNDGWPEPLGLPAEWQLQLAIHQDAALHEGHVAGEPAGLHAEANAHLQLDRDRHRWDGLEDLHWWRGDQTAYHPAALGGGRLGDHRGLSR
jgi:hypothetical protein